MSERGRTRGTGPLTRSEAMARVRSKNTAAELTLRRALWEKGLRYRVHAKLPGTPDLVFPGPRVAVFVDGCFWHGCKLHYTAPRANREFWAAKLARNISRDARVDLELAGLGWTVLRIWEHEVERDCAGVVGRIDQAVRAGRGTPKSCR